MSAGISIKAVGSKSELNTFIRLPWKIYEGDPNCVQPLMFDLKRRLGPKNPYFEHAKAQYFLAYRGTEPVGRISAMIDSNYDKHWGGKTGHFGWFECIDDQAVARDLFDAAGQWLRTDGRDNMQGPYNMSVNDECGLLIDGFDSPPMILMTYNPAYYQKLCEDYGMFKAQDLLAYRLDASVEPPEDIARFADMVRHREGVVIRPFSKKEFKSDMIKFLDVYNNAWEKNWGMVPMTDNEIKAHALEMKNIIWPELAFFAEQDGKTMGVSLSLPNLNEVIIKLNGKLFPTGFLKLLRHKSYESCRVFALGVKNEFRKSGVGAVFYYDTLMAAKKHG